jgi:hypothetical protein
VIARVMGGFIVNCTVGGDGAPVHFFRLSEGAMRNGDRDRGGHVIVRVPILWMSDLVSA